MFHFELRVVPAAPEDSQLFVYDRPEERLVVVRPHGGARCPDTPLAPLAFSARVRWGGADSPMLAAMPTCMQHGTGSDPEMRALVDLICAEFAGQRCGSETVLNRLAEVLIVRILRAEIERGKVDAGLWAGLSDKRLARALVGVHKKPGAAWTNDALAMEAGLSTSRFLDLFRAKMGETPQAYLRKWRISLAQRDVERGHRIEAIARRYGYGSPEALTRAFKRMTGRAPTSLRPGFQRA